MVKPLPLPYVKTTSLFPMKRRPVLSMSRLYARVRAVCGSSKAITACAKNSGVTMEIIVAGN